MAGAWIRVALEQLPNGENGTNAVSSNTFDLRADSIKIDDGFKPLEENEKTLGVMGQGPHLGVESYSPKVEIKGLSCRPSDLALVLALFGGTITPTAGGSGVTDPDAAAVPAGCAKHVIGWAADTPKTAQILAKDGGGKFWKVRGAGATDISMAFKAGAFSLDVSMVALYAAEIVNPSVTLAFDAATAFRGGDMTLTWLAGSANTRDFDCKLSVDLETDHGFSSVSDFPDLLMFANKIEGCPAIGGTITKRTMVDADWDSMVGGDQFAATIKLTHREEIGSTGRAAAAWIVMPGVQHVKQDPDDIANVRRRETKFDWSARVDIATASLAVITVVNATAAYETYA